MYPLFELLEQRIKDRKDVKTIDINLLCTTINNIATTHKNFADHYEEILALIYHYDNIYHNDKSLSVLPFNSKTIIKDKGFIVPIYELPLTLQKILAEYIEYYKV